MAGLSQLETIDIFLTAKFGERNLNCCTQLKTPYSDGTTHVIFEALDFIAKLASLVPKPRVNLTRFHGVFAPNSKHTIQAGQRRTKRQRTGKNSR